MFEMLKMRKKIYRNLRWRRHDFSFRGADWAALVKPRHRRFTEILVAQSEKSTLEWSEDVWPEMLPAALDSA